MKNTLILSIILIFSETLYSVEQVPEIQPTQQTQINRIENIPKALIPGTNTNFFTTQDYPEISINVGKNKSISCVLEKNVNHYLCPNNGKPILLSTNGSNFTAILKDSNNSLVAPFVSYVEAGGKPLFGIKESKELSKIKDIEGLTIDNNNQLQLLNIFFLDNGELESKESPKGSDSYQKISASFIKEKNEIEKKFRESKYVVELQDGKKVNCTRDRKIDRPSDLDESYLPVWESEQCGSFKCDGVKVDGKDYQVTMFLISDSSDRATIHLIDNDGIGPIVKIKKVLSSGSSVPLIDYYTNYPAFYPAAYNNEGIPSTITASTKYDDKNIKSYKDYYFQEDLNFLSNTCTDDNKALKTFLVGREKYYEQVASLELAELIQVLANGTLLSQYVDPAQALKLGCFYEGVYFDKIAANNLDKLKKNIYPDKEVGQTISLNKANQLFKKASKMKNIAWKYKQDGCYARAHLMARRFEAEGVRVDKVWIKGELYVAGSDPLIEWKFHVAPVVYVNDGKNGVKKMVIDPSLFSRPVTVEEWDKKISKKTKRGSVVTAFPFPENAALMERSAISFSSSDPYLPNDSLYLTEKEKMKKAKDTMKLNKKLEKR